jgi:hypothetical protein
VIAAINLYLIVSVLRILASRLSTEYNLTAPISILAWGRSKMRQIGKLLELLSKLCGVVGGCWLLYALLAHTAKWNAIILLVLWFVLAIVSDIFISWKVGKKSKPVN